MDRVAVGASHLAYDSAGRGPAVVLCHAGIADHRMWAHQAAALADGHRVVVYDWRGVGASGPARGDFAHHENLLALLDGLDVDRAVLVGASMGAGYALDVALADPGRVAGLVLVSPGLSGHRWPASFGEAARQALGGVVPPERLDAYRQGAADQVLEADVAAMAEAQARFTVAGPTRGADEVDPQVWALVVNGQLDVPEIQALADLVVAGIPGARRLDVPDAAHLAPAERPEEVTAAIGAFVSEVGW